MHVDSVFSNVAKKIGALKRAGNCLMITQAAASCDRSVFRYNVTTKLRNCWICCVQFKTSSDGLRLSSEQSFGNRRGAWISSSLGRDFFLLKESDRLAPGTGPESLPGGSKTSPDWYAFLGYRGLYKRRRRTIFSLHLRRSPTAEDCLSQFSAKSKVLFRLVSTFLCQLTKTKFLSVNSENLQNPNLFFSSYAHAKTREKTSRLSSGSTIELATIGHGFSRGDCVCLAASSFRQDRTPPWRACQAISAKSVWRTDVVGRGCQLSESAHVVHCDGKSPRFYRGYLRHYGSHHEQAGSGVR